MCLKVAVHAADNTIWASVNVNNCGYMKLNIVLQ